MAKPVNYLSNKNLLAELKISNKKKEMSNELAKMLQLLCKRYARKGSWAGYSYNEDMQAYAMMMLVKAWANFNVKKSQNPFAFFTQCIKNSFIQFLNQEKTQRNIRDAILMENSLDPSYNYKENADGSEEA